MISLILATLLVLQDETNRPQSVESSYIHRVENPHYNVRNITSLSSTAMDLVHMAMQDETDDSTWLKILKYGFSAWVDTNIGVVAHEYGHISAFSKLGVNMQYKLYIDDAEWGTVGPHKILLANIIGRPAVSVSEKSWDKVIASSMSDRELALYVASIDASGLNQEQLLVTHYAERYLAGNLSYLDSWAIIWGNFTTFLYPTGLTNSDVDNYIEGLNEADVHTSIGSVKNLSLIRFLSGSSLSAFSGLYKGIGTRTSGFIKPIHLHIGDIDLYLPEFESFLCQTGPTVKTRLPIKAYNISLAPSIEVSHGAEFGLKLLAPIGPLEIGAAIYAQSNGYWVEGHVNIKLIREFAIMCGYERGSGYTFHRNIYGASLGRMEHSAIVGVDFAIKF